MHTVERPVAQSRDLRGQSERIRLGADKVNHNVTRAEMINAPDRREGNVRHVDSQTPQPETGMKVTVEPARLAELEKGHLTG